MPHNSKLLIFSDIHNDWKTLERLLAIEADYYIAAGDQVTWAKGIERCGEILQTRGDKVYVLPGNHESADQVAAMCARHGLHNFHERHIQVGRLARGGTGLLQPHARSTPPANTASRRSPSASSASPSFDPLVLVCHAPPYGTALDQVRPGLHAGSRSVREFIERVPARALLLRPHPRGRRRRHRDRPDARAECRQGRAIC